MLHRLFIAYLLLLNPAGDLVLCWAENGHFAVEDGDNAGNCCAGDHLPAGTTGEIGESATPDWETCESCFDVRIAFELSHVFVQSKDSDGQIAKITATPPVTDRVIPAPKSIDCSYPWETLPAFSAVSLTTTRLIL